MAGEDRIDAIGGLGYQGVEAIDAPPGIERYRARSTTGEVEVTVAPGDTWDELHRTRLGRTADLPGLTTNTDIGTLADGSTYVVTEAPAGRSLAQRLSGYPRPGWRDVAETVEQAAGAAYSGHLAGLRHGRLDPDHVWIDDADGATTVRLAGMGLSPRRLDPSEIGEFTAPEVGRGQFVTERADVYSLGKVLAAGLDRVDGDVPPSVRAVAEQATREDPLERTVSAREFAGRLRAARTAEPEGDGGAGIAMGAAGAGALAAGGAAAAAAAARRARGVDEPVTPVDGAEGTDLDPADAGGTGAAADVSRTVSDEAAAATPTPIDDGPTTADDDGSGVGGAALAGGAAAAGLGAAALAGRSGDHPDTAIAGGGTTPEPAEAGGAGSSGADAAPVATGAATGAAATGAAASTGAAAAGAAGRRADGSLARGPADRDRQEERGGPWWAVPAAAVAAVALAGGAIWAFGGGDDDDAEVAVTTTIDGDADDGASTTGADDDDETATTAGDDGQAGGSTDETDDQSADGDDAADEAAGSADTDGADGESADGADDDDTAGADGDGDTDAADGDDAADEGGDAEPAPPAAAIPASEAGLEIVHGIPGAPVDVYADGELLAGGFQPGQIAGPLDLPEGATDLQVFAAVDQPAGSAVERDDSPILTRSAEVGAEPATLVAHLGPDGTPTLSAFTDNLSPLPAGRSRVVVRHTAAAERVDVGVGDEAAAGIDPGGFTTVELDAGPASVAIDGVGDFGPIEVGAGELVVASIVGSADDGTLDLVVQRFDQLAEAPAGVPTGDSGLAAEAARLGWPAILAAVVVSGCSILIGQRRRHARS